VSDRAPSFEEVKALIASRKPPVAAHVVERRDGEVVRQARVIHDGINGWYVDDGDRIELRAAEDRATFVERGTVERIGPGMVASANTWVKIALDGRRMAELERSAGEVVGPDELRGRACWVARVVGLRGNEPDVAFQIHVDAETGILLRTAREDVDVLLDVEDLVVGTVYEPEQTGSAEGWEGG
jgi:hypothetical protein